MHAGKLLVLFVLIGFLSGCQVVEDGEAGISKSFGKVSDKPLGPGLYPSVPLFREVEVWNIKKQRFSKKIELRSNEGLDVGVDAALLFRPENVIAIRSKIGLNYVNTEIEPKLVDAFRKVVEKERIEEIIKNQETIRASVQASLEPQFKEEGVVVEDLLVTAVHLPEKVNEAIEQKLQAEQKAIQKESELAQAKKDAQIEVERARGAAEAQEIVRSTLSSQYLQYLWITKLSEHPNVIYVATEGNMPLLRMGETPKGGATPKKDVVAEVTPR